MRQDRAGQAASQAASQMEQALKQLERGQDAQEDQEEALERLDEAQREIERTREEAEEELAREQAAKAAEEIKRLKERHETLMKEAARIEKEVQKEGWARSRLISTLGLSRAQRELGDETANLAEKKLAEAQVFARLLQKTAQTMERASEKFKERVEEADKETDPKNRPGMSEEAMKLQKDALRRLDQLLEALKQEPGMAMRPPGGGGGGGGQGGQGGGGGGAESLPPVIQYKLLKAMQSEINQKTEDFAKQHPDESKWTDKVKAELQAIRKEQREVADLLDDLAQPPDEGEGGKP